jgi:hypothetical protein
VDPKYYLVKVILDGIDERHMLPIPATLSQRIEAEIQRLEEHPPGHINHEGRRQNALPLFGTVGEVWLLRPDGTLWRADSDFGRKLEPLPNEAQLTALAVGAQRYPFLRELLPSRPDNAVQCDACAGRGRIGPGEVLFCYSCGTLGWVSPTAGHDD